MLVRNIWNRFIRTENLLLALMLVCTTLLLVQQGWLWRFDQVLYDEQLRYWQRPAPADIVIVAVDEDSIDSLGSWPWSGQHHTNLLSRLFQDNPRAISFYFPLKLTDSEVQALGAKLADGLPSDKVVGLAASNKQLSGKQTIEDLMTTNLLAASGAKFGHIDVIRDKDGIVRSTYVYRQWPNLNLLVSGKTDALRATSILADWMGNPRDIKKRILIPFAGPPAHFQQIPYYKILNGEVAPGAFDNKFVMIGITDAGFGSSYPIPRVGFESPMSSVEVNANILDAVRSDVFITQVGMGWLLIFSGMFALIPFFLFPFFSPRSNVIVTCTLVIGILTISLLLVINLHVWLPPAAALVSVALSYLLWSARRLENAVQYLGNELSLLNAEQTGREKNVTSRLGSVFTFLEKVLPISGWCVADTEGQVTFSSGDVPNLSGKSFIAGVWLDDGIQYWTSLTVNRNRKLVGIRWSNPNGPTKNEKAYLERLAKEFSTAAIEKESSTVEVVQKLIKQVQDAIINLRTMHQFLDDSLTQMANGVLVVNDFGKVLFANRKAATFLRGNSNEELEGKDITQLLKTLTVDGSEDISKLFCEALLERFPASANVSNQKGRDLLLQITPLSQDESEIGGVIFNLSDISHLKSVERARNETLSFVSHDLRSPLVSVLALLELAKHRDSPEELHALHQRIGEYTQLTISLAEQFIQLARIESDENIKLEIMDMASTAINAQEQAWVQAQSRKITILRDIELDHAWVKGDSGLLGRAVTNLLNNAIKYSPKERTVRLKLFRKDGHIWCCVEDEGYGIPEAELPYLFDRFRRAHLSSGVDEQGIGLGLALVKATAERHGGYVEAISHEGEGSRFCLVLPETGIPE